MKKVFFLIVIFSAALYIYNNGSTNESIVDLTAKQKNKNSEIQKTSRGKLVSDSTFKRKHEIPEEVSLETKAISQGATKYIDTSQKVSEEEMDAYAKYFEEVDEKWNEEIEDLFVAQLGLSKGEIQKYHKMQKGYENDKQRAYERFHQEMEKKHGPNYEYSPSRDEELYDQKLVLIYEKELFKMLGKKGMGKYRVLRGDFNAALRKNENKELGLSQIEF